MDKVKNLVDEVNEIVGVLLFVASVVMHQVGYIGAEMMFNGFIVAGSVYLGIKGLSSAGDHVRLLLKKMSEDADEEDDPDDEAE